MPKNKKQSIKKAEELTLELESLMTFSKEFYIAGLEPGNN